MEVDSAESQDCAETKFPGGRGVGSQLEPGDINN